MSKDALQEAKNALVAKSRAVKSPAPSSYAAAQERLTIMRQNKSNPEASPAQVSNAMTRTLHEHDILKPEVPSCGRVLQTAHARRSVQRYSTARNIE